MSDKIKSIAQDLASHEPPPKKAKVARTMKLDNRNYSKLLKYCNRKKKHIGDVVDTLIQGLITELEAQGELLEEEIEKKVS